MSDIRRVKFADLADNPIFLGMTREYESESSIDGMGPCNWNRAQYELLEANGALFTLGAYQDDELIGFAIFLVTVIPHYGAPAATTESVYIEPANRKGRTGIKLIQEMEAWAKELGAVGIFLSSPVGGRLAGLAPWLGYRHTNQVFFKGLNSGSDSDT